MFWDLFFWTGLRSPLRGRGSKGAAVQLSSRHERFGGRIKSIGLGSGKCAHNSWLALSSRPRSPPDPGSDTRLRLLGELRTGVENAHGGNGTISGRHVEPRIEEYCANNRLDQRTFKPWSIRIVDMYGQVLELEGIENLSQVDIAGHGVELSLKRV